MEETNEIETNKIETIRLCNICGVSSDVNKFKMVNNKICARKCLKCTSKQNNIRLRTKEDGNYFTKYYKNNKDSNNEKESTKIKKLEILNIRMEKLKIKMDNLEQLKNKPTI
jgi:hypothetical protein